MRKTLTVLFFIGLSLSSSAQQEPIYTQYSMNQAMFNPSYVAVNNVMNVSFMSRVQWVGLKGAPLTNTLTGSTSFFGNKGGAGILLQSNSYGITNNLEIFAQAAYKITLGIDSQLSIGIQGGYLNYRNDFTKIPEAINDPIFLDQPLVENITASNVGMGIFFNSTNFYLGLSIPKFIEYTSDGTTSDLLNYKRRYYGSTGVVLPLGLLKFKANVLTIITADDFSYELGASLLLAETIWAGIFTRNLNAFGAMGMFEITDRLKLGLTVELPSTELVTNQYGSYEMFFSWELATFNRQILKRRYF